MKKKYLLIIVGLMIYSMVSAQLPEKSEDISPLLVGEMVPEVILTAADGQKHNLADLVSKKPAVILFYRGGWCPYCNSHLADIQNAEEKILELGYQIIAISPDSPEKLTDSEGKHKLAYTLLSDADGELMKQMGIAFKGPERYEDRLSKFSGGLNTGFLPVPSTFVVGKKGTILFEYINPDYKTRITSNLLIAVLENL